MNYVLESPGVYRCTGCGHGVRTETPERIRGCRCKQLPPCIYLGQPIKGEFVACTSCRGTVNLKVFACGLDSIKKCLPLVKKTKATTPAIHKCDGCDDRPKN